VLTKDLRMTSFAELGVREAHRETFADDAARLLRFR